ncbi:MAG: M15 family metallopeptidase [Flavobacteriaceae bacterium]|nr:M15 family metallopeptidase [Flavobacteriaceae bacterium]
MRYVSILLVFGLFVSCRQSPQKAVVTESNLQGSVSVENIVKQEEKHNGDTKVVLKDIVDLEKLADTTFVRLADYDDSFEYDMRYATTNNFLKAKVYNCAECYIRAKTAKALIKANNAFKKMGYRIKFYDCYRPNSVQYKMWKLVPNPQYVANPVKGSIHNKGGAVDITLIDANGKELSMGTDFDFFGKKAHHDFVDLPKEVLENRKLLKETMESFGFWGIRTEWWHYNLSAASNDKVANFNWPCKD